MCAGTEWLVPKSPVAYHTLGLLPVCICRQNMRLMPCPDNPLIALAILIAILRAFGISWLIRMHLQNGLHPYGSQSHDEGWMIWMIWMRDTPC